MLTPCWPAPAEPCSRPGHLPQAEGEPRSPRFRGLLCSGGLLVCEDVMPWRYSPWTIGLFCSSAPR